MSNFMQYVVSLLIIVAIAAVDVFLVVEQGAIQSTADMVWIDGSDFTAESGPAFTDPDASQNFQSAGFWIDSSTVSRAEYEQFTQTTGYVGAANVRPSWLSTPATASVTAPPETIFALRDSSVTSHDERALRYIANADALAYCNWKGWGMTSSQQEVTANKPAHPMTLHASQPLSQLSGFRCVKLANP